MPAGKAGVTDYSKWDKLDDSDDEKHSHPNIDIGLQRRIQRELRDRTHGENDDKKKDLDTANDRDAAMIKQLEDGIKAGDVQEDRVAEIQKQIAELKEVMQKREDKAKKIDDSVPLYVNGTTGETNLYKEKFNVTSVQRGGGEHKEGFIMPERTAEDDSYDRREQDAAGGDFFTFKDKHRKELDEFISLGGAAIEDTFEFLKLNASIMLQEAAMQWVKLMALEFEMEESGCAKFRYACRQSEVLFSISELSKANRRHPGNILGPFAQSLKDPEKFSVFTAGVAHLRDQIKGRAIAKRKEQEHGLEPGQNPFEEGALVEAQSLKGLPELNGVRGRVCEQRGNGRIGVLFPEPHGKKALKKENLRLVEAVQRHEDVEEELRAPRPEDQTDPDKLWWLPYDTPAADRLGPGGLDPCEVFKELPVGMQEAFRSREIKPLQDAIAQLSEEDAIKYIDLCTKSGIWNPGGGGDAEEDEAPAAAEE